MSGCCLCEVLEPETSLEGGRISGEGAAIERVWFCAPVKLEELERGSITQDAVYRYDEVLLRIVPVTGCSGT
jgi:hypothetical protein